MTFTSFEFLIFLPVVVLVNFIIPQKFKYIWLLITGLFFYASIDYKAAVVMAVSVLTTYCAAIIIEKGKAPKLTLLLCGFLNAALILTFRSGSILGAVGISFYGLKAISYIADVYRGEIKAEKNLALYALYVSFFAQVVAGPIERAGNMLPQFKEPERVSYDIFRNGLYEMIWGYFLKMVIADRLAVYVGNVYSGVGHAAGGVVFLATVFYTFQIYCDFAGYSHIAIGVARMLGIEVRGNFDVPYLSMSIAEFWRRWHISLSRWLRDYIYIPLGGNRKGTFRKYINILLVFAISGLWHGTDYNFIVWGILHALFQIFGYVLMPLRDKLVKVFKVERLSFSHRVYKTAVTFMLVNLAWVFFRADTITAALDIIKKSVEFTPWILTDGSLLKYGLGMPDMIIAVLGILLVVITDLISYNGYIIRDRILSQGLWIRWIIIIGAILVIFICGIWGPGYDSASFIYQQF